MRLQGDGDGSCGLLGRMHMHVCNMCMACACACLPSGRRCVAGVMGGVVSCRERMLITACSIVRRAVCPQPPLRPPAVVLAQGVHT